MDSGVSTYLFLPQSGRFIRGMTDDDVYEYVASPRITVHNILADKISKFSQICS